MAFKNHPPLKRSIPTNTPSNIPSIFGDSSISLRRNFSSTIQFTATSFDFNSNDSCYASASEASSQHSSLSRESSDPLSDPLSELSIEGDVPALKSPQNLYFDLLEFAIKLGYDQSQLDHVLEVLTPLETTQDNVLSELIKLGKSPFYDNPPPQQQSKNTLTSSNSNSISSSTNTNQENQLRAIVIDGSNIAMTYGHKEFFACKGIQECVNFFTSRGHTEIFVFIPNYRRELPRSDSPITDQHILFELENKGFLTFTPSRRMNGRRIVCHDDRYILNTALDRQAIIVSNDEYRDLVKENNIYKKIVQERLLMYSFVANKFMPPDDPLGRHGPTLDQFLSKTYSTTSTQICPYYKKCTFGNKCKFYHPERNNESRMSTVDKLLNESMKNKSNPSLRHSLLSESQSYGMGRTSLQQQQSKSSSLHKASVTRTTSLNPNMMINNCHSFVARHSSTPLGWSNQRQMMPDLHTQSSNYFSNSMNIWGHPEMGSSSSVMHQSISGSTNMDMSNNERARLEYHLCQLFPSDIVLAVMALNPFDVTSEDLCKKIIAYQQKGF
uniref:C3H1-type domain-containing protein n=1 Tax=Rhabditophanes sp. KR3021 TaxID=114890 RepID=A0AC35TRU4_9BILA